MFEIFKVRYLWIVAAAISVMLSGCGGSSSTASTAGFAQAYTASAGAGEVLQFSVDTTNMTYSYTVVQSSYAVPLGQTSTGTLTSKNAAGSYDVSASADGFIQSGVVFPVKNGMLVGHVQITAAGFDGTQKIPVFGVSNPIVTVAGLADTYNYQGFGCGGKSGGNVLLGTVVCASHYGTLTVDASGNFTKCKGADITTGTLNCISLRTGTITATATPGVYDFVTSTSHSGWFFAFTAPNGQKVAVIDHDDAINASYGHSVASTQASVTAGAVDGNYFVKDNQGNQRLLTVTGTGFTNNTNGNTGTLAYNSPWNGMVTHTRTSSITPDGVVMIAGTGAFTGISLGITPGDAQRFIIGMKY